MEHVEPVEQVVSRETLDQLHAFEKLILQWTKRINLVSRSDLENIWQRHILDCLQLVPFLPPDVKSIIDLGSGAGFPGLILAIATNLSVTLIESDRRKAAFLRTAAIALGVDATILCSRIEVLKLATASLVTARALAPLPLLLELAYPKLTAGGFCLFLKGQSAQTELTAALKKWHMKVERFASRTAPNATILRLSEIRRVIQN